MGGCGIGAKAELDELTAAGVWRSNRSQIIVKDEKLTMTASIVVLVTDIILERIKGGDERCDLFKHGCRRGYTRRISFCKWRIDLARRWT